MSTKKNNNNNISANEFQSISESAKGQIRSVAVNPFYYINQLNKLAAKNEYCDNTAVKPFADILKGLHGQRYGFTPDILEKDSFGRFVTRSKFRGIFATVGDCVDYELDNKGREIIRENGEYIVLCPIAFSLVAFFNAFKRAAKVHIIDNEKQRKQAAKEAEKAEKKAQRDAERQRKQNEKCAAELSRRYMNGEISEQYFNEAIASLKAA